MKNTNVEIAKLQAKIVKLSKSKAKADEIANLKVEVANLQAALENYRESFSLQHAEIINWANASLETELRVKRAIDLCEFILSGTGPDEATAQERTLARSVLTVLATADVLK